MLPAGSRCLRAAVWTNLGPGQGLPTKLTKSDGSRQQLPPPPEALERVLGQVRHTARRQGQGATWLDVFANDGDVAVPVWPRVLVPEADDMAQFVDNDAELVTVLAD